MKNVIKDSRIKNIVISVLISLTVAFVSWFLTRNNLFIYQELTRPPLSPPSWVFGVVWTILFILMGISAGIIYNSDAPKKENALCIYEVQLFFNVLWSLAFFNFRAISVSIGIILILWVLIILMIRSFYKISPLAAYLQIPYLIWVTFATYLNIAIYILNK